ncbi:MAG: ZTL protein [Deltaproteobacteria bacterium]|nr:ZTL protein [Deltaproteobacteria bacterium]
MATITALAGINGAGKSSVTGHYLRSKGGAYFNPDEAARAYRKQDPHLTQEEANSRAWLDGKILLEVAIRDDFDHVFETTLGGETIPRLLGEAVAAGHLVRVVFVGLESADKHIERVRARVARGGHDIAEDTIRKRYRSSRLHLVQLLPALGELVLFDNSLDADPASGHRPSLKRLLHMKGGVILHIEHDLGAAQGWAKPILAAAMGFQSRA